MAARDRVARALERVTTEDCVAGEDVAILGSYTCGSHTFPNVRLATVLGRGPKTVRTDVGCTAQAYRLPRCR